MGRTALSAHKGDFDLERENCILISNRKNWIEQAAVDQLRGVAKSTRSGEDGRPAGSPSGKDTGRNGGFEQGPVLSPFDRQRYRMRDESVFHRRKQKKFKMEKWETRLNSIRELCDIPCDNPYEGVCPIRDLGTIGTGNHFAEFQCLEHVYREEEAERWDCWRAASCYWSTAVPGDTGRRF